MEITIALAQYPIVQHRNWEAWETATRNWVEEACAGGAKVIVFPEYGAMELTALLPVELLTDLQQQIVAMQDLLPAFLNTFEILSCEFDCVIVAPSFPVRSGTVFVNRAYVVSPKGISYQDKHFMTRFEDESWGITSSDGVLRVFETPFGKFGVQLCFDIEFAIGSQLLAQHGAEFIVVPSCTETLKGATRVHIGARARAMEQQFYVGVAQTVGNAEWTPSVDINYGYTAMYTSPDGDFDDEGIHALAEHQTPGWLITTIDTKKSEAIRKNGQVLNYQRGSSVEMSDGTLRVEYVVLGQIIN